MATVGIKGLMLLRVSIVVCNVEVLTLKTGCEFQTSVDGTVVMATPPSPAVSDNAVFICCY